LLFSLVQLFETKNKKQKTKNKNKNMTFFPKKNITYMLNDGIGTYINQTTLDSSLKLSKKKYEELWSLHPEERPTIFIFGKHIKTPRWFQNYGHEYKFSGNNNQVLEIPEILQYYLDYVNSQEPTYNYNGILVNWYQDGSHYIGKHSDDEKDLIKNSPIYCFSFGSERKFIVESKSKTNKKKHTFTLDNNSLTIMGGECQKYYTHAIPKTKKPLGSRISITIRAFK
jgi:alkylated DNA repair dioxygenase AlkB